MLSKLPPDLAEPTFPFVPAMPHRLDAAATLAFMTPLQEHPPAADGKAGAILTVIGLMFSLLASQADHLMAIISTNGPVKNITLAALGGFALLSLATIVEAFRTIAPRFPKAEPSLAFFGDIAALPREDYIRRVEAMSADEALQQILNYNHTLSRICVLKFGRLRKAIRLCQPAFACWLIALVMVGYHLVFS